MIAKHLMNQTKENQFLVPQIANNVVHLGLIWMHAVVAAVNYYHAMRECLFLQMGRV